MGRGARGVLDVEPELVLTDFVALDGLRCPQRNLVRGDQRSATVAAASIIAKVARDRLMAEADQEYPQYGFGRHKGYATLEHMAALADCTARVPCTGGRSRASSTTGSVHYLARRGVNRGDRHEEGHRHQG